MTDQSETSSPDRPAVGVPDPMLAHVVYGLFAIGLVSGLTPVIGVILAYLKRKDVTGTYLESHFTWQIRTFWVWLAAGIVGIALLVVGVGFLILLGLVVWVIYRIVKGWLRLGDRRPIEDPESWL